jgi:hypothetical protein
MSHNQIEIVMKLNTKIAIRALTLGFPIIILLMMLWIVDSRKKDIQEVPWRSSDVQAILACCESTPRWNSPLWTLLEDWRPATSAELDLWRNRLPHLNATVFGGASIYYPSISAGEKHFNGISLETGACAHIAYPPSTILNNLQLLVRKKTPVVGYLTARENNLKVGIFPIPCDQQKVK